MILNNSTVGPEIPDEHTSPWLVRNAAQHPASALMRLFCFHYAGATASMFRSWPQAFPPPLEVIAIQLPGREYRLTEPLISDLGQIAAEVAESLTGMLDQPFAFFGHSMGALIGFDVIRILRSRGQPQPDLLIVSGRNAPEFQWRDPAIRFFSDEQLIEAVREYAGTPEALLRNPVMRELWLPRFRADMTASVTYRYVAQQPLECPIVVMSGEADPLVNAVGLKAWATHTTSGVRFHCYPGNHFFVHTCEDLVLDQVRAELSQVLAARTAVTATPQRPGLDNAARANPRRGGERQ